MLLEEGATGESSGHSSPAPPPSPLDRPSTWGLPVVSLRVAGTCAAVACGDRQGHGRLMLHLLLI